MTACSVRCGGVCCTRFPLNMSPALLGARYLEWVAFRDGGGEMTAYGRDLIMIAEMVIPLAEESDERPTYTCRHFDPTAGLCTVYEDRPAMCADYPGYGRDAACIHCGFHQPEPEPDLEAIAAADAALPALIAEAEADLHARLADQESSAA